MCRTLWKRKWSILTVLLFQTRLCLLSAIQHKFTAKKYKYHIHILVTRYNTSYIRYICLSYYCHWWRFDKTNLLRSNACIESNKCNIAVFLVSLENRNIHFYQKHSLIFYPKISFFPSFTNLNVWSEKCGDTRAQK